MQKLEKIQFMNLELAELVKQLNNAMDIAQLGLYEWNVKTNTVRFDKRAYEIIGVDPNTFDHTMASILRRVIHPDSLEEFQQSLRKASAVEIVENKSYRLSHPKKEICWIKFMSRIIKENGETVKLVGVIMDVTNDVLMTQDLKNEADFVISLIENVSSPFFYKDTQGFYRKFNKAFADFLGLKDEQIRNKTVYDVAPKHLAEIYEEADNKLLNEKGNQEYESLVMDGEGRYRHVVFRKSVHLSESNKALGIIGLMQDVTELRTAEKTLRKITEVQKIMMKCNQEISSYETEKEFLHELMIQFMMILDGATSAGLLKVNENQIVSLYDSHGISLNKEVLHMPYKESYIYEITQGNYNEVCLVNELSLFHLRPDDLGQEILKQNIIQSMIVIPVTYLDEINCFFAYGSADTHGFSEEDVAASEFIRGEMDALIQSFVFFQKTVMMARYDAITGLMNRGYFDKSLKEYLEREPGEDVRVVIIDLEDFKQINDRWGHDVGDRYLNFIGESLNRVFSDNGFWGRIGGDEFAGLVHSMSYQELEEKLLEVKGLYNSFASEESKATFCGEFSYGISSYFEDGISHPQLLKVADSRMYDHKKAHKRGR